MIKEKVDKIKKGKFSAVDNIKVFLDKIRKENPKINAVLHINNGALDQAKEIDNKIKARKAGRLAGLGFIVKSNINVQGLIVSCASKTLENYEGSYNATVIQKLLDEDAIVLGMANMDEFACGGSGETSAFNICKNPRALDRITGGSSSGSAAAVASKFCDFSLGSDTGGSIRNPASHCGVVGYKPSYGSVSRYGLIDLSMSLDQIGPMADEVEDCKLVFDVIKGRDERDASSLDFKSEKKSKIKVGIPKVIAEKQILDMINNKIHEKVNGNGWEYGEVNIDHIDLGVQTYYPINYVEFFSGTRRFDGRKYGYKIEDKSGEEVRRRLIGGKEISQAEFAGKFYRRALKAKKIIGEEFNKAFDKYEIIVMPTVPKLPHKLNEAISVEDMYNYDSLTVLANLAEIPAISIPAGTIDGVPVGVQLFAKKGNDDLLLEVAGKFS